MTHHTCEIRTKWSLQCTAASKVSRRVMISEKTQRWWVFQMPVFVIWVPEVKLPSSSIILVRRHTSTVDIYSTDTLTTTVWSNEVTCSFKAITSQDVFIHGNSLHEKKKFKLLLSHEQMHQLITTVVDITSPQQKQQWLTSSSCVSQHLFDP